MGWVIKVNQQQRHRSVRQEKQHMHFWIHVPPAPRDRCGHASAARRQRTKEAVSTKGGEAWKQGMLPTALRFDLQLKNGGAKWGEARDPSKPMTGWARKARPFAWWIQLERGRRLRLAGFWLLLLRGFRRVLFFSGGLCLVPALGCIKCFSAFRTPRGRSCSCSEKVEQNDFV